MLLINIAIALVLTVVGNHNTFASNMIFSNCIGFSISCCNYLLCNQRLEISWQWRTPIAIICGVPAGFKLAHFFGEPDVMLFLWRNPESEWRWLASALLVSSAAAVFFILFYHSVAYKHALEIAKREQAEARQAETLAQLAMLQAQIEPHFLFNTLANVHSLITRDAALAQTMLEHLNQYLRASLSRTRQSQTSLADEIDLVRALLAISQIRLGDRLRYQITIAEGLQHAQLPPLLLQPLVENALEHGIEPAVNGGEISITAQLSDEGASKQLLRLRVSDTGQGLQIGNSDGVGLANVRARLQSLYGDEGRLALYPNAPHGVIAELSLPYRVRDDSPLERASA
ncbi:histidine kinase [Chitinibacter bivalviorum]|uniref:Histidine kinase n=2 Tax=Chitinibacter bivalviorum TaxID=2739434 RepID=A0A7H9BP73_9NEIS|nr:histidine kinase [Chitinibacter bivalviorum]